MMSSYDPLKKFIFSQFILIHIDTSLAYDVVKLIDWSNRKTRLWCRLAKFLGHVSPQLNPICCKTWHEKYKITLLFQPNGGGWIKALGNERMSSLLSWDLLTADTECSRPCHWACCWHLIISWRYSRDDMRLEILKCILFTPLYPCIHIKLFLEWFTKASWCLWR